MTTNTCSNCGETNHNLINIHNRFICLDCANDVDLERYDEHIDHSTVFIGNVEVEKLLANGPWNEEEWNK